MKAAPSLLIPTLIMATLALSLLYVGYSRGEGQHIAGLKYTGTMILKIMPLLVCAFLAAGMMQQLVPAKAIAAWVGAESGLKGIFIAALAGGLTPGGPFICLPLAAGVVGAGAAPGPVVAYLTGWSVWAIQRLPLEAGILGWKVTMIRFASTLILPPLAGIIAQALFSDLDLRK